MHTNLDQSYIESLISNPTDRVPVCFCLDSSYSMWQVVSGETTPTGETTEEIDGVVWNLVSGGVSRYSLMHKGIMEFIDMIKEEPRARASVELFVVSFSDKADCVVRCASVDSFSFPDFEKGRNTNIAAGINLSLDILEERKSKYKQVGVKYYQPILVVISDGNNNVDNDAYEMAKKRIYELERNRKLTTLVISCDEDSNIKELDSISSSGESLKITHDKIESFFYWLSRSVSSYSKGTIEKVTMKKNKTEKIIL